jgi:hypothetical protein
MGSRQRSFQFVLGEKAVRVLTRHAGWLVRVVELGTTETLPGYEIVWLHRGSVTLSDQSVVQDLPGNDFESLRQVLDTEARIAGEEPGSRRVRGKPR